MGVSINSMDGLQGKIPLTMDDRGTSISGNPHIYIINNSKNDENNAYRIMIIFF